MGADGGGWGLGPSPTSPRFDILAPEEREARGARRDMWQHRPAGITWRGCHVAGACHVQEEARGRPLEAAGGDAAPVAGAPELGGRGVILG